MKEITKNTREVIRVERTTYNGGEYIDARVWAKTYDKRGFVRTKKGLTIPLNLSERLLGAIKTVVSEPNTTKGYVSTQKSVN